MATLIITYYIKYLLFQLLFHSCINSSFKLELSIHGPMGHHLFLN